MAAVNKELLDFNHRNITFLAITGYRLLYMHYGTSTYAPLCTNNKLVLI